MAVNNELSGKVAIVTGAGRNIGRAIALALAAGGASIVVNARSNRAEADAVAREVEALRVKALVHIADVADAAAVQAMADMAVKHLGRIDILVNNAAHGGWIRAQGDATLKLLAILYRGRIDLSKLRS